MATSNYKVLTDVDLSRNSLLNVSNITNTDKTDTSLLIKTDGDTTLDAANLTGKAITGTTSLTTKNSEVIVTGIATEEITTSKTTTVAAATPETTTTETIDREGVRLETPSQTVTATSSSKVESPSITLVTGTPEGTGANKQAKIALTKSASIDDSKIDVSAKTIAVDAATSITQTSSVSTYRTDKNNTNSLKLTTDDVKLKSDNEAITLTKAKDGAAAKTEIRSNNLVVNATAVEVKENTSTSIKASSSVSVGVGSGDPSPTTIEAKASDVAIKSNKVTITGRNTTDAIKLVAGSTSVSVLPQQIKLDSDSALSLTSDTGVTIHDDTSATVTAPIVSEEASTSSTVKSPSITLVTGPFSGDSTKQASIALTKSASPDSPVIATSAKTVIVDANVTDGSITQTAPTSIYKADADNKLTLGTGSVEIKSGTEAITLTKSASTQIVSRSLVVDADSVEVRDNKTLSTTSSGSITVTAKSSDGTSSVTTNPTKIGLESKEVSLTASVTESEGKKSSRITLSPAAEIALSINTDKNLKIKSVSGTTIKDDNNSIALDAPVITGTASNSVNLYSGNINLQNKLGADATERITLNNKDHKISITANNAGVDVVGDTSKTVTVTGDRFNVNSGKSMFAGDSEFSKNVKVVGNLTTKNMTGEAAELSSLDVTATTTVTGNLETGTANFSSVTATGATVTGSLVAGNGLTARGLVGIDGVDEHGKSLTINGTASTDALKVAGELKTEKGGVTSAGSVSILNNSSADKSLTVNNTAEVKNLSVPSGTLIASSGMTSRGAVTVGGTTSVGTITGTGSLDIPGAAILKATSGGTTGRVGVTETTIHTIKGDGFLEIPASSKLTVAADSTSDSVAVTNIEIATVAGEGSLEIPEGKKLTINNGGTSGTSVIGTFSPTDVTINTVFGDGNLEVPSGKTLTVSNGGTINGSVTIGKADSTATNLTLNGNATIGTSGSNTTNLTSYAKIHAENGLAVKNGATFEGEAIFKSASINTLNLNGVTIEWNSSLGALTFSRG